MSEKKEPIKSTLNVKLLIKRKGYEIATEGTIEKLSTEIEALASFAEAVTENLDTGETETEPQAEEAEVELPVSKEDVEKIPTSDIPAIKSSKSTIENISSLFDTPWGKTPRTLAEIMKALEVNAVPDKIQSVNVYMRRLVQRGALRRLDKEGKYVYFKLPG